MWVRIEKRREQKGARGRRKGSLTMDAFPKEGKRGPPPNTKLPTVHTFPSTPPTSRRLACRICWTVRPEGMGAARLQDCETRRDYVDPCWRAILHGQTTGRPARTRQWLQHPSSDMGPAPETRNSAWRLQVWSGQWQRIQPPNGARECLSCESRPPRQRIWTCCTLLYSIFRHTDVP